MTSKPTTETTDSLFSSWGIWAVLLIVSLWVALVVVGRALGATETEKLWTTLAAVFGMTVGLTAGMLASPLDKQEGKQFAGVASIFSAFASGFLLSKVERLFEEAAKQGLVLKSSFLVPVIVSTGCGLIAAVFVWLWRKYGFR